MLKIDIEFAFFASGVLHAAQVKNSTLVIDSLGELASARILMHSASNPKRRGRPYDRHLRATALLRLDGKPFAEHQDADNPDQEPQTPCSSVLTPVSTKPRT
ncbi:MAG TPA: hypothetical protein VFE51_25570 [Verrucomicrobiae bacterium]|nr:hypothetical protein [Verrucomicrobiae bacterium]